ncbi:hypothetical protein ACA910_002174 [Epithemia clementina (nom. ined.)]
MTTAKDDNIRTRVIMLDACALNNMAVAMMVHGRYQAALTALKDSLCILQIMLQAREQAEHDLKALKFLQFRQERLQVASACVAQLTTTTTGATPTKTALNDSVPQLSCPSSSSFSSLSMSLSRKPPLVREGKSLLDPRMPRSSSGVGVPRLNVVENNDTPSLIQAAMVSGAAASRPRLFPPPHEENTTSCSSTPRLFDNTTTVILIREPSTTSTTGGGAPQQGASNEGSSTPQHGEAMELAIVLYNYGVACSLLLLATRTSRTMMLNDHHPMALQQQQQHNASLAHMARKFFFLSHDSFLSAQTVSLVGEEDDLSSSYRSCCCHPEHLEVCLFVLLVLSEASKVYYRHEEMPCLINHYDDDENDHKATKSLALAVQQEQIDVVIAHMMEEVEWYAKSLLFADMISSGDSPGGSAESIIVRTSMAPAA